MKFLALILSLLLLFASCNSPENSSIPEGEELGRDYYKINMNNDYVINDCLESVPQGTSVKVIMLLGQSNATGCSLTSYLKQGVSAEKYAEFENGYSNVLINFSLDNQKYSSKGAFVPGKRKFQAEISKGTSPATNTQEVQHPS